ncbi:Pimeloyl-ACP methyl ester carboxylesterase [Natronoarchaeum philippinense]|uniref:Pimeloyl-ACP methyl ester carboxylesterase n=1 Tax=Natronoarchaeum philippinense TaxID=558529 RepID=A0A285P2X6_NATPI|nr:alpha/beta hydrolase [Natronoarchaeum philippinense]SNZ16082.1 Pimeloyl-ACP methyl ester carboxylesterase [Natronoarchaeum philippinense]
MDLPDDWTTGTVRANGIDIHYYRTGSGPPIVMAHGYTDNGRCWAPLAADLRSDYDLIMYDARGHGKSDAPASGYGIDDRVEDFVGVVRALDLDDPIFFGHSMGGSAANCAAAAYPELPRALVLEDPAGMLGDFGDPDARARDKRAEIEGWQDRSVEEFIDDSSAHGAELEYALALARTECSPEIAQVAREGYPDAGTAFEDVRCPTLVLKADAEPAARADHLDAAAALADGRLVHVPGAEHCVFRTRYDAAYRELRTFLRRRS